jgi:hypothetical protein
MAGRDSLHGNEPTTDAPGARVLANRPASGNRATLAKVADVGPVSGPTAQVNQGRPLPTSLALQSRALLGRTCAFEMAAGQSCRATPLRDERYCFWHSPEHAQEAENARRLGGLRRRREKTITSAYDLEGLSSVDGIRRVLDIAIADTLGLENSVARSRVLIAAAMAATRLLEVEGLDGRPALLATRVAPCSGQDDETCPG